MKEHAALFATVSAEELAGVEVLDKETIAWALQQGRKERREAEACESARPVNSGILFRAA